VSAVRSIGKASAAKWEGDALHRARGCLSASGVFRSMYLLGVIVAGFLALWNVVGFTHSQKLSTYRYYCTYHILVFFFQHRVLTSPTVVPILLPMATQQLPPIRRPRKIRPLPKEVAALPRRLRRG
jgi:hypothetical protein